MDIVKIQEQYAVSVFDLGIIPMGKKRFDVDIADINTGHALFVGEGDSEFEAKAAAVKMFNEVMK